MIALEIVLSDPNEGSELVLGPFAGLGVEPRLLESGARVFEADGREVARLIGQSLGAEWRAVKGGQPFGRRWPRMDIRPIA
jgi:hypothetical protein